MSRLTFGLTSLSKSLLKARRFWQFCEEARLQGQPVCVYTHSTFTIFPPSCIVFPLNDPLPDSFCLEQNIINWITPPLLDQRSPRALLSRCLPNWGASAQRKCQTTIHELQLYNNPKLHDSMVCADSKWARLQKQAWEEPKKKKTAWFGFSW